MGEERQEAGSTTGTSAFDGPCGDAEHLGGFGYRIALHVYQDQCGALVGGKGAKGKDQFPMQFIPLSQNLGGLMRLEEVLETFGIRDRGGAAGCDLAGTVQAGIYRDPVQPGGDGGLATEGVCGTEGGDQGVLDSVGGLLAVPQSPQCDSPQAVTVAAHQFAEGIGVA